MSGGTVKPLSAERFSVNFTADSEFHPSGCSEAARELLEEVRALISHSEPKGDLMRVMKRGLQALRAEVLKKRFGVGRKPRRVRSKAGGRLAARTRYVAADVTRAVWLRDGGRCTACGPDGKRCAERRLLQLDHVQPFSSGGESTIGNLRLRCRAHNLHAARRHFGKRFMRVALRRARSHKKVPMHLVGLSVSGRRSEHVDHCIGGADRPRAKGGKPGPT